MSGTAAAVGGRGLTKFTMTRCPSPRSICLGVFRIPRVPIAVCFLSWLEAVASLPSQEKCGVLPTVMWPVLHPKLGYDHRMGSGTHCGPVRSQIKFPKSPLRLGPQRCGSPGISVSSEPMFSSPGKCDFSLHPVRLCHPCSFASYLP